MSTPQVQQDPVTGVSFYINAEGQRFDAVNGAWVAHVEQAPPQPVMPPQPMQPSQQPVMPQPVAVPVAAPMQDPGQGLEAMMSGASGGAGVNIDDLLFQDMSDVSDDMFRVIPEGTMVESVIKDIEITLAKGDQGKMIKLSTVVCFPDAFKGVPVWDYIKLSDVNSRWKFKRLCRVTGLMDPTGTRFCGKSILDFKGQVIRYQIMNDLYNGIKTNKVAAGYEIAYETPGLVSQSATGAPVPQGVVPTQPMVYAQPSQPVPAPVAPPQGMSQPTVPVPQSMPQSPQPDWPTIPQ